MKIINSKQKNNTVSLELESSLDVIEESFNKTFKSMSKMAKIPGFRKGKVPRHIFEQHYGKDILIQDSVNDAVNTTYKQAIEELKLDVVDYPKNLKVDDFKENQPIKFSCDVDVKPKIKADKYKGVKVTTEPSGIDNDLIETQLKQLKESHATYEIVSRETKEEDLLKVNVKAAIDGEAYSRWTKTNVGVCIGTSIFSNHFDKNLVGAKANTPLSFSVPYPADYHLEDVAGKKVDFEVEITEIKEKRLADLTDELVQKTSEFKTVDELKNNIKTTLEDQQKKQKEEKLKNDIMEIIIESNKIDLPEGMIRFESEQDQRYFESQLQRSGTTLDNYLAMVKQSKDDYIEELNKNATKRIKSQLILESVIDQENIEASDDDIKEEIKRLRPELDTDEKIETELKKINQDGLKQMIAQQKAIDFILEKAKITEKKK